MHIFDSEGLGIWPQTNSKIRVFRQCVSNIRTYIAHICLYVIAIMYSSCDLHMTNDRGSGNERERRGLILQHRRCLLTIKCRQQRSLFIYHTVQMQMLLITCRISCFVDAKFICLNTISRQRGITTIDPQKAIKTRLTGQNTLNLF